MEKGMFGHGNEWNPIEKGIFQKKSYRKGNFSGWNPIEKGILGMFWDFRHEKRHVWAWKWMESYRKRNFSGLKTMESYRKRNFRAWKHENPIEKGIFSKFWGA
jgi:hypothetical protein